MIKWSNDSIAQPGFSYPRQPPPGYPTVTDMDNTAPDRQWVTCPGCAEAFDPDHETAAPEDPAGATVQCPFCSTRFTPTMMQVAPEAIPSPVTPHDHLESTG